MVALFVRIDETPVPRDRIFSQLKVANVVSTRDLSGLPAIDSLRMRMQEMAALESVFAIEYGEPIFDFQPKWNRFEQMAALTNGSGDELFLHFTPKGCCIIGFAHESAMSPYRTNPPTLWPGLLSSVPDDLKSSLEEPAFSIDSTTFVVWRRDSDDRWHTDDVEYPNDEYGDGSQDLLSPLVMSAEKFADWLAENYEVSVDSTIVASVFAHQPLTNAQIASLNNGTSLAMLRTAIMKTGYSVQ